MSALNETLLKTTNNQLSYVKGVLIISVWSTTLILDFLVLVIEFKSRLNLIRLEFIILVALSLSSLIVKISAILTYIGIYVSGTFLGQHTTFIIQWVSINATFFQSMSLFYYSLYHVTFLKRSSYFLFLFNLVHNLKSFVIYLVLISGFSLIFTSTYMTMTYLQIYSMNLGLAQFQRQFVLLIILEAAVPPFLASSVYFTAFLIAYFSRLKTSSETKRTQKNLKLLLKFLLLAIVTTWYILPKVIYANLVFYLPQINHSAFEFLNYLGDFFFFLIPIILISIHDILLKTFMGYFNQVFSCIRK